MAKSEVDQITDEKIAKGGVLVKFYFDMQHKEKEKLQPLMTDLINERLMKEKGVIYCYGVIEEPMLVNDVYSTSATVTVLFDSFLSIINVAFNYAPAGVEIMRPTTEMTFRIFDLHAILMDLSQLSVTYSRYMLEHVLKGEDLETVSKALEGRAELGKKLLEKKSADPDGHQTPK